MRKENKTTEGFWEMGTPAPSDFYSTIKNNFTRNRPLKHGYVHSFYSLRGPYMHNFDNSAKRWVKHTHTHTHPYHSRSKIVYHIFCEDAISAYGESCFANGRIGRHVRWEDALRKNMSKMGPFRFSKQILSVFLRSKSLPHCSEYDYLFNYLSSVCYFPSHRCS